MFLEILLFVALGTGAGFLIGLIPGIHPNMIILLVPSFLAIAEDATGVYYLTAFIVGLGVANSFSSFIPSIYLGASDDAELLSASPGHEMLLEGKGHHAAMLTVFGGITAVVITSAMLPFMALTIPFLYNSARGYIWIFLLLISAYMILSEDRYTGKILAFLAFSLSGILGIFSFKLPIESTIVLFPVLSGFFGIPILLEQITSKTRVPEQKHAKEKKVKSIFPSISGTAGGVIAGFLPGVGSTVIASLATREKNKESFLISMGAITAANIIISFLAMWLIGNPRSGVAVAISQLTEANFSIFMVMTFSAMVSAALAALMTMKASEFLADRIHKIDYTIISAGVVIFILAMVVWFSGLIGMLLIVTSSALGIFTARCRIRRGILMGVLIIPAIMFFL